MHLRRLIEVLHLWNAIPLHPLFSFGLIATINVVSPRRLKPRRPNRSGEALTSLPPPLFTFDTRAWPCFTPCKGFNDEWPYLPTYDPRGCIRLGSPNTIASSRRLRESICASLTRRCTKFLVMCPIAVYGVDTRRGKWMK